MDQEKKKLYEEYLNYITGILHNSEGWSLTEKAAIEQDISVLREKLSDDALYLGVIGAFSSGKSTFINSILNKGLLPTDAVQGTTVTAAILKKAPRDDLVITYTGGINSRYTEDEKLLRERYTIEEPKVGIFKRVIRWIICHLFKSSAAARRIRFQKIFQLFTKLVADDTYAKDITCVTLELEEGDVVDNIAIVDTPGTESLTPRHAEITKYAVDNICDAVVVIIPYDTPVSQMLLEYLQENFENQLSNLIFVVTKVELLGDLDELDRLLRVIRKRLENGLEISSPVVIPMPTLLHLETADEDMKKSGLFTDMPKQKKQALLTMYQEGRDKLYSILGERRDLYIKDSLYSICERLYILLQQNIEKDIEQYDANLNNLLQTQLPDPNEALQATNGLLDELFEEMQKTQNNISVPINEGINKLDYAMMSAIDQCSDLSVFENALSKIPDQHLVHKAMQDPVKIEIENLTAVLEEAASRLTKRLHEIYGGCVKRQPSFSLSDCSFDWSAFDQWVQERANEFSNECLAQSYAAKKASKGFIKRLKSLFSDPLPNLKYQSRERLHSLVNGWRSPAVVVAMLANYETMAIDSLKVQISLWISENNGAIQEAIHRQNAEISQVTVKKSTAKTYLYRLQHYMKSLKEEST